MKVRANSSLSMYIDDGAIFTCGRKWRDAAHALRGCYTACVEWLTRAGLNVGPDKTELMFFRKRREKAAPPPYLHLPFPS